MNKTDMLSVEELYEECHRRFEYRDGELYYKIGMSGRNVRKGNIAGSVRCKRTGRKRLQIGRVDYYLHRLIYLMHHKVLPDIIDHIDRNPKNNRIENLRPATCLQNNMNRDVNRIHKTKNGMYESFINIDGGKVKFGPFCDRIDAAKAWNAAAVKTYGEFARLMPIPDTSDRDLFKLSAAYV